MYGPFNPDVLVINPNIYQTRGLYSQPKNNTDCPPNQMGQGEDFHTLFMGLLFFVAIMQFLHMIVVQSW